MDIRAPGPVMIIDPSPKRRPASIPLKETWGVESGRYVQPSLNTPYGGRFGDEVFYKVNDPNLPGMKWKSSRIMPEWASRSHARIVSVRPERVQEITEEAAIKEGILGTWDADNKIWKGFYREGFRQLWESIYPGSWGRNDWAWRIELEKL